ncbi:hypothetical protein GCM10022291_23460 [Postechiella marina]|uniref:Amino acid adenylation domain-containing protein n=1 Tax=Postechiella marina TaxID=943941 RepID=A0ABP8CBR1_9FLAO
MTEFWTKKLSNSVFTQIPRWSENANQQKKVESYTISLSEELSQNIIALSKKLKAPISSILLSSHCKVLSVVSGNIDIITGLKIGVNKENTLPLRVQCDNGSWNKLINNIISEEKAINPFLQYTLNNLKAELNIVENLFETYFLYKDHNESIDTSTVNLDEDISFGAYFSNTLNKTIQLNILYNVNEFSREQIETISEYYCNTLKLMAKDETKSHTSQSILPIREQHTLLELFNNKKVDYPTEKTFVDVFEDQVKQYPDKIAIQFEDTQWTYNELNNYANTLAKHLIDNKLNIEESVIVIMERDQIWVATVLGILKAGGVYVPVRPDWPKTRKSTIINKTDAKFVIHDTKSLDEIEIVVKENNFNSQLINGSLFFKNSKNEANPSRKSGPDNLAYIIFTSGSTGEPKGAMIEHKGMLNHLFSKVNDLEMTDIDIVAQNSSQSFDISVWQLISGLMVGAKTVIYSDALILDMHQFLNQVKEDRITILELVPSYMKILLQLCKHNRSFFETIKYLMVTGEPLKIGLVTSWFNLFKKIPLVNAYGPTEASDDITHHFMYETPKGSMVPVGTTIQNLNVYVVDAFDQLAPIGTKGNVVVSGVGVGRGYIGDPEKTNAVFTHDHLKPKENLKLYKTGDIGSWTHEGILHLFGREDNQIKLNGYRIDLGEIEQSLSKQKGVTGNAVLLKGKSLHAFLVFDSDIENNQNLIDQCKAGLQKDLPHYMIPRKFHVLEDLPLTQNGKIDRNALQKL